MRRQLIRRSASVALAAGLLGVAGCGDSEEEQPLAEIPATTTTEEPPTTNPYEVPAVSKTRAADERKRERARKRKLKKRRDQLVRSVAMSQLTLLGLGDAVITTEDAARSVTIALSKTAACKATDTDASRVGVALKNALVFVNEVAVRVRDETASLSDYRTQACGQDTGKPGGTLIATSGTGSSTTAPFTVRSERWSLEYTAGADAFYMRVYRNGRLVRQVGAPKGRSGRRTIVGGGLYKVEVEAEGKWSLRARELG